MKFLERILYQSTLATTVIYLLQASLLCALFYGLLCASYTNHNRQATSREVVFVEEQSTTVEIITLPPNSNNVVKAIEPTDPNASYGRMSKEPVEPVGKTTTFKAQARARKEYRYEYTSEEIEKAQETYERETQKMFQDEKTFQEESPESESSSKEQIKTRISA